VVISGAATGADNTRLLATNVIAGVEPILQSAPQRQGGQSLEAIGASARWQLRSRSARTTACVVR